MAKNNWVSPSLRSQIHVKPNRGSYDKEIIYPILDDAFICHVGFTDNESPFVIPVLFGRKDDQIFFHGGKGSRMLKTVKKGDDICITVTLMDGLVLARSAFHHSLNYRSVVIFGKAYEVEKKNEKEEALKAIMDHLMPGRWDEVRKPNDKELQATTVLGIKLDEASAKMRSGPVSDDEGDMDLPVWAGVIPMKLVSTGIEADTALNKEIELPEYIREFSKGPH